MPFEINGQRYITHEDLDREYEELVAFQKRWDRRERVMRLFGGERGWPVRLWFWIAGAFTIPPKPPADPQR